MQNGKKILVVALALMAALFLMRAYGDHSQNDHYAGDFFSDTVGMWAAKNYEHYGYLGAKLLPVINPHQAPKPEGHYLHYPPLPYLYYSLPKVLFGADEFGMRLFVLATSSLSVVFAYLVFSNLALMMGFSFGPWQFVILIPFLFLTPTFLVNADIINGQSALLTLFWVCLYWSLRYLKTEKGLVIGTFLMALQVWVSFDWIVPIFGIFSYLILTSSQRKQDLKGTLLRFFLFGFLGVAVPCVLRLVLNAWYLGGLYEAIADLLSIGKVRGASALDPLHVPYDFAKHLAKILLSLPWLVGIPNLLLCVFGLTAVRSRALKTPRLWGLLVAWALGSVSWQVLMPQHGMVHAYTYLHFTVFLMFFAGLSFLVLWDKGSYQKTAGVLFGLHLLFVGGAIHSQVLRPFHKKIIDQKVRLICENQRQQWKGTLVDRPPGLSLFVVQRMAVVAPTPSCDEAGDRALSWLQKYLYFFKATY